MRGLIDLDWKGLRMLHPSRRAKCGVSWVAFALLALTVSGCGGSGGEAVKSPEAVNRQILHLEQGVSVDEVKAQIGEPDVESTVGSNDELRYGIWQLAFTDGRLNTRSKVIAPKQSPSVSEPGALSKTVRGLHLGAKLGNVEAILGIPEVVYVVYEGRAEPVRVLRYGSWELTFVDGALTLRAQ
jgi:hypothetical protein